MDATRMRTGETGATDGAVSGRVQEPTSVAEAAECLRDTSGSVLFRGGGTKLDWAGRTVDPDLVLSTARLSGVLTHNAADMTASVSAGTPLDSMQEALAADGQWLALDPPSQLGGATVGGLLAAGDSGPSRLRYGNLRDLVIGVTLVLADGTVARSGGHVIKNVAGYDLAKLMHGSLGSLALVVEVVLRLHPRPVGSVTVTGAADVSQAAAAAGRIAAGALEPTAVEWLQDSADRTGADRSGADRSGADRTGGRLVVRVDGSPRALEAATGQLTTLLGDVGITAATCPPEDIAGLWQQVAATVTGEDGDTVLRLTTLPTDLVPVAQHLAAAAEAAGVQARLVSSAALGVHTVRLRDGSVQARGTVLEQVRRHALDLGGQVLLRRRPAELDDVVDALGPPPSSVELLRRIKAQFDPTGRCAPGRFQPWF